MSITDELRKEARGFGRYVYTAPQADCLTAIADRIDEAHKHAIAYVDDRDPEMMAEHGWIRLPLDADGVPIHVGDVMEWCDPDGEVTVTCEVDAVGVECFFAWDGANGRYAQKCANAYRHHHPPTVEDVLLEACKAYHGLMVESMSDVAHDMPAPSEVIAEYAAKLRLAGDGE